MSDEKWGDDLSLAKFNDMMVEMRQRREAKGPEHRNEHIRSQAIERGQIDGVEYWIVPGPHKKLCGLNGYAVYEQRPVIEPDYHGIMAYVPVHGGITYCEEDELGCVYGFDTAHFDSDACPREDPAWIREQIAIMIRAIKVAAEVEQEYLDADGNNEKRAELAQRVHNVAPDAPLNMGEMLNLLGGEL